MRVSPCAEASRVQVATEAVDAAAAEALAVSDRLTVLSGAKPGIDLFRIKAGAYTRPLFCST